MDREPVLVSKGADKCIKMSVFDSPDDAVRLLRSREVTAHPRDLSVTMATLPLPP